MAQVGQEAVELVGKVALHRGQVPCSVLPEQADDSIVQRGHHLRPVPPPQLAAILLQRHVPAVMQPILHPPLRPGDHQQPLRIRDRPRQARHPIAHLVERQPSVLPARAFELEHVGHIRPVTVAHE